MSQIAAAPYKAATTAPVLGAISFCHLLNDMLQSLLPAIYPILKGGFNLSFGQIGLLTLTYQITASLLQPVIGLYTDRRPLPFSLPVGMGFTLLGMVTLAVAPSYVLLLAGAALLGIGSSIFHPESSRIARLASGGKHGLAQSVFQVGGNFGSAMGPLLAAFFILPHGRVSLAWFALAAFGGMIILTMLGQWYRSNGHAERSAKKVATANPLLTSGQVKWAVFVLLVLVFSKYFYLASITSYYIFYLMHRFHLTVQVAQVDLFIFLGASAVGTVAGGPIGDRFGRKRVIWGSILGCAAVYAGAALCGAGSDDTAFGCDRADSVLGVFRDRGLCAGIDAWAGWDGFRAVLRVCVRHGRDRGRGAGLAGRLDEYRDGVSGLCVFAAVRVADGVFAEG